MEKLIYVDDSLPGITRRGAGTGFAYYSPKGELIRDPKERERLNAIALPPAYKDAWFCPAANGHILATGVDDRGRKQYRYHPDFRRMRESEKFDGCVSFGKLLPLVRARVDEDISQRQVTDTKAIAALVRLLDLSAIRIGSETYSQQNETFGATTLRHQHADIGTRRIDLTFSGKGGKEREVVLNDPRLARAVQRMKECADDGEDDHLFRYLDEDGDPHPVTAVMVNQYLADTMGEKFTAKNFRTWHASVLAFECLLNGQGNMPIKSLLDCVSQRLGNTPAIVRSSYIHPAVIAQVDGQKAWRDNFTLPRSTKWLSRTERGLIDFLESAPAAEDLLAA